MSTAVAKDTLQDASPRPGDGPGARRPPQAFPAPAAGRRQAAGAAPRRSLYATDDDDLASQRLERRASQKLRLAETWVNARDGSLMRLVPGGPLRGTPRHGEIASGEQGAAAAGREGPRRVLMPAFYLGALPVTNAQFARFLGDVRPDPKTLAGWLPPPGPISASPPDGYEVEAGCAGQPVAQVSPIGAEAYCRWAGLRLPSEDEWLAAGGAGGRAFPRDEAARACVGFHCACGVLHWERAPDRPPAGS